MKTIFEKAKSQADKSMAKLTSEVGKSMKPKPKHGGARKGAGRPRSDKPPMKRYNVVLDTETVHDALVLGYDNLSLGLRIAVKRAWSDNS